MKPKVLLAKYLDWAVIAIISIVLIYAFVSVLILAENKLAKLESEMKSKEKSLKEAMTRNKVPPLARNEILGDLKNRIEHLSVIDPYRRNPFLVYEDIKYPNNIQLVEGQTKEVNLKAPRFIKVVESNEKRVVVALRWLPDDNANVVVFRAVAEGTVDVRIQAEDESVYRFTLRIRGQQQLSPPNPPQNVQFAARSATEDSAGKQPAMVLVIFQPENPPEGNLRIGDTTHANIFRKPADGSDAEYVPANDAGPVEPASREKRIELIKKFLPDQPPQPLPAAAPATKAPAAGTGPLVAEEATEITPFKQQSTAEEQANALPEQSFVFLDTRVDGGESYTYKIVTLSKEEEDVYVPCKEPYVRPTPVQVPALVEFTVVSIGAGQAGFSVSRIDPDTRQRLSMKYTVMPGMMIGKMDRVPVEGVDSRHRVEYKNVDFSTGCMLIDTLPALPSVGYRKLQLDRSGKEVVYRVQPSKDPSVMYLTPHGFVRLKSKSESTTVRTPSALLPFGGGGAPALPRGPMLKK